MKRIFLAFLLAATTLMYAQSHMNFRGIEINGTLDDFVSQMQMKKFMKFASDENSISMYGQHHGLTVVADISATPLSQKVYQVTITYPTSAMTWNSLYMDYGAIKVKLSKTYGEPVEVIERFDDPYSTENNPLQAFKEKKATFITRFLTTNGGITLHIVYLDSNIEIQSIYWDKENTELNQTESTI